MADVAIPDPVLEDGVVRLRPWTPDDAGPRTAPGSSLRLRGRAAWPRAVGLLSRWRDGPRARALALHTDPDNHPSERVAERCGSTREGVLRRSRGEADAGTTSSSSPCSPAICADPEPQSRSSSPSRGIATRRRRSSSASAGH